MSDYLKKHRIHLVYQIKKIAKDDPPDIGPGGGGGGAGGAGGGPSVVSASVSEMQKAIQRFADEAVKYNLESYRDPRTNKITRRIKDTDRRRDFNDFLAEQFMEEAKIHGQEFSTREEDVTKESKLPTEIIELRVVIDSLKRIGSPGAEKIKDGVWDFRTNNAIKNTYAFASALVTAHEALGGLSAAEESLFNRNTLNRLAELIPKEYDPEENKTPKILAELNKKAKLITPLIKNLTQFYAAFSKRTLEHAAYKQYINQEQPLYKFTPGGTNPYKPDPNDPNQKKFMENPSTFKIPVLELKDKNGNTVNLNNKLTLESFQSLSGIANIMTSYLRYSPSEVSNPRLLTKTVQAILSQVRDFLEKNNKSMPSTTYKFDPYAGLSRR